MLGMKTSRGDQSKTLGFITASWATVWLKYLTAGATLPFLGEMASMSAGEFATSTAGLMAVWLGHEWPDLKKRAEARDSAMSEEPAE